MYEPVTSLLLSPAQFRIVSGENSLAVWLKRFKGDAAYQITINLLFLDFSITTNKMGHAFTSFGFLNLNVPKTFVCILPAVALRWQLASLCLLMLLQIFSSSKFGEIQGTVLQATSQSVEGKPSVALVETFQISKCSFFSNDFTKTRGSVQVWNFRLAERQGCWGEFSSLHWSFSTH